MLLITWCVILLLGAMPPEITPPPMRPLTDGVQAAFDRVGVRSGSFVFSGRRGDSKRRYFAIRAVAWHADGSSVVIHESPEGLAYDAVRWTVPMRDTISFKMLDFETVSQLISAVDEDVREQLVHDLRRSARSGRIGRFFCESDEFRAGDPRDSVSVEIYDASVSYATGALTAHRETVLHYSCKSGRLLKTWPDPSAELAWPGVTWR